VKTLEQNDRQSFLITISGTENYEWQGELQRPDGTRVPFRSVLELLREMNAQIGKKKETEL
jgi:hypothetical protein